MQANIYPMSVPSLIVLKLLIMVIITCNLRAMILQNFAVYLGVDLHGQEEAEVGVWCETV